MSVAVILNTNQLGGAERSLIEQLAVARDGQGTQFRIYVPALPSSSSALKSFLHSHGLSDLEDFAYPQWLYQFSRADWTRLPLIFLHLPSLLFYFISWVKRFWHHRIFYVNGNKAFLPIYLVVLAKREANVYWHFRDFPSPRAFMLLGKILTLTKPRRVRLELVANSHAVAVEVKRHLAGFPSRTIYNLSGGLSRIGAPTSVRRVGVASMFAPWKGHHDVILMISSYREELIRIGIEKFIFFGESIYQTRGEHNEYQTQLRALVDKLELHGVVEFVSGKSPAEIFGSIDLLLHSSLSPEPFGRVILEAFKCGVPVVSTALGGAGELVLSEQTGLRYTPYDLAGMFRQIERLAASESLRQQLTGNAREMTDRIEREITQHILSWDISRQF